MSLEEYTESDRTDHEIAKLKLARMLKNRSYKDRISAKELAKHVPVSTSTVRDLIGELRREHWVAIYSRGSGYYEIQDADELQRALDRIDEQIQTKKQTKHELTASFNRL
jgi:transposase